MEFLAPKFTFHVTKWNSNYDGIADVRDGLSGT